jgi:hypothetical protein
MHSRAAMRRGITPPAEDSADEDGGLDFFSERRSKNPIPRAKRRDGRWRTDFRDDTRRSATEVLTRSLALERLAGFSAQEPTHAFDGCVLDGDEGERTPRGEDRLDDGMVEDTATHAGPDFIGRDAGKKLSANAGR